jgi:hypothetical protein
MRQVFYWDKEKQAMVEGYPPQPKKYAQAPYVIGDTIDAYYHPGAGVWVESKAALRDMDRATGCITSDKLIPANPKNYHQNKKEIEEDIHNAVCRAVEEIDSGRRQFSEEEKVYFAKENERLSKEYNFDAFNVAGKKNDTRGKRARKRKH